MSHPSTTNSPQLPRCAAKALDSCQRQELAVSALSGQQSVSKLAEQQKVSRKFVYTQSAKAKQALDEAFCQTAFDDKVLFYLPVTKAWLRQLVLALVLICHSSLRGVVELLRDLFQMNISVGGVHNIVAEAIDKARQHNEQQDLSAVRIGAHDEIFQHSQPVLAGVDVYSTYCYLLSLDEQRDGETWGLHLFDLQESGFAPEAIIADAGQGIRKGQKLALPDVPCRGDVFHGLKMVTELVVYLENRAYDAISACDKLERKQAQHERRQTVRASSIIENFNSRLRSYFFLRRHLGPGYLQLLQFFLNHRRFLRSEHPQRVNKSPAELLNGTGHAHWLEMLGYQLFSRN